MMNKKQCVNWEGQFNYILYMPAIEVCICVSCRRIVIINSLHFGNYKKRNEEKNVNLRNFQHTQR